MISKSVVGSRWSVVGLMLMLIAVMVNAAEQKHYFAIRSSQVRVDSLRIAAKWERNPAAGATVPLADLEGRAVNMWLTCQANADIVKQDMKVELAKRVEHVRDTVCTHDEMYDWLKRHGLQILPDVEAKEEIKVGK